MKITLPDKSVRELEDGSTGYDLAKDIGPGLGKSAVAITIDGELIGQTPINVQLESQKINVLV